MIKIKNGTLVDAVFTKVLHVNAPEYIGDRPRPYRCQDQTNYTYPIRVPLIKLPTGGPLVD
ncbi:MAG: hypothetical protein K2F99_03585, partial [Muribaculaceae bacterium]|nr:hypothetical protein [Muribaculaceae bacterium]